MRDINSLYRTVFGYAPVIGFEPQFLGLKEVGFGQQDQLYVVSSTAEQVASYNLNPAHCYEPDLSSDRTLQCISWARIPLQLFPLWAVYTGPSHP